MRPPFFENRIFVDVTAEYRDFMPLPRFGCGISEFTYISISLKGEPMPKVMTINSSPLKDCFPLIQLSVGG